MVEGSIVQIYQEFYSLAAHIVKEHIVVSRVLTIEKKNQATERKSSTTIHQLEHLPCVLASLCTCGLKRKTHGNVARKVFFEPMQGSLNSSSNEGLLLAVD